MKMTVVNWRNIVDEVRCWDAADLLHNLDDELENARKGFTNCLLCLKHGEEEGAPLLLKPEISVRNDHLEISFSDLEGVEKDDIDVSIENGEILVNVEIENEEGGTSLGWFRMRIPHDFDGETCEAEHCDGTLTLLLRRKKKQPSRKNIKLK
jgi:hypothetical protein